MKSILIVYVWRLRPSLFTPMPWTITWAISSFKQLWPGAFGLVGISTTQFSHTSENYDDRKNISYRFDPSKRRVLIYSKVVLRFLLFTAWRHGYLVFQSHTKPAYSFTFHYSSSIQTFIARSALTTVKQCTNKAAKKKQQKQKDLLLTTIFRY